MVIVLDVQYLGELEDALSAVGVLPYSKERDGQNLKVEFYSTDDALLVVEELVFQVVPHFVK